MSAQPSWKAGAPSDYSHGEIVHWPGWRGLIGWDVFLNNLTAGITVVLALAWWLLPATAAVAAPVLTLAWLVLMSDLLVLVADLGDPARFHHMLRVFKRQSPMSVGVWALSAYAALLTLAVLAVWIPAPAARPVAGALTTLTALPALVVLTYKGVLFSCTSQPGLREARWLAGHLASSGLLLGAAVLALVAGATGSPLRAPLHGVMLALLLLALATLVPLLAEVLPRLRARYPLATRQSIYWLVLMGGIALPLVLVAVAPGRASLEGAALLVLMGGLVLRHAVVRLAEPVAKAAPH